MIPVLSQDADVVDIRKVQSDPMSFRYVVRDVDWSWEGGYIGKIGKDGTALADITATVEYVENYVVDEATGETQTGSLITLTTTFADEATIPAGILFWYLQQEGGVTRVRGRVFNYSRLGEVTS